MKTENATPPGVLIEMATPRGVLIRDLLLFQLKLLADGVKDIVVVQISIGAAIVDLLFGGRRRGKLFYGVLRASERFDLWLNLHGPAKAARDGSDGLLNTPPAGADGVVAKVEEAVQLGARLAHRRWTEHRSAAAPPTHGSGA